MKINFLSNLFWIVLISLLFTIGCKDEGSVIGYERLDGTDLIKLNVFSSDSVSKSFSQIKVVSNLGSFSQILVGKYDKLEASALVRFTFPLTDTVKNSVNSNKLNVLSAKLRFYPVYRFGDSTVTNYKFNIYDIKSDWSSDTFNADSLNSRQFVYSSEKINTSFSNSDSLVICELTPGSVLSWLQGAADTSKPQAKGIYLKADASSSDNLVKGFRALPNSASSGITYLEAICQYGSTTDTIIAYTLMDVHAINSTYVPQNNSYMYAQSGVEFRTGIKIELSSIDKNSVINKAKLQLFPNNTYSQLGGNTADSLIIFRAIDNTGKSYDSSSYSLAIKNSDGYYEGNVLQMVQRMVSQPTDNFGFIIGVRSINGGIEFVAFESPNSTVLEKRPRLNITFATKNK